MIDRIGLAEFLRRRREALVGLIRLRCRLLVTPDAGLRVRILLPLEGTDAAEKLELLRVIGTQQFLGAE